MKKLLFILLSMMSVSAALRAGNEIRTTDPQKLPATAREFIATHFPDTRIALIKIDREGGRADSYDVLLENGSDLEFDRRGQWTEIDAERTTVPQSIIPLRIADYLKRNYPDRAGRQDRPGPPRVRRRAFGRNRSRIQRSGRFSAHRLLTPLLRWQDSLPRIPDTGPFANFSYLCRERPKAFSGKRSAGRKTTR